MHLLTAFNFASYGDTVYFGPFPTRERAMKYAKSAGYENGINNRKGGYEIHELVVPFVCDIKFKDQ
jgi:hypothetical protein